MTAVQQKFKEEILPLAFFVFLGRLLHQLILCWISDRPKSWPLLPATHLVLPVSESTRLSVVEPPK